MKIPHKCGKKILRKMVKSKENQESRKIISTIQETKENRCKTQKDEDWFEPRRKCSSRGQELSKTREWAWTETLMPTSEDLGLDKSPTPRNEDLGLDRTHKSTKKVGKEGKKEAQTRGQTQRTKNL